MLGSLPILPLPAPPTDGNLVGSLPPAQLQENSNDEVMQDPPPDIRTIIDKTATFVAKNGADFEERIIASNAGNPKFGFLNASHPYHAYYQHRLSELRAQN